MNKIVKFIILLIVYTISLYLSYNQAFTTYAYIVVISMTWIVIIQELDKELTDGEKLISSGIILVESIIAILGHIGTIPAIMGVVGTLITEMIFYALITETTKINMPKILRTIILIICAAALAFLIENIGTKLLDLTSSFFVQDRSLTNYISQQYAISVLIYNLGYSLPLYFSMFFIAYVYRKDREPSANFNDLGYVLIIVIIPLFAFIYNNMISDQFVTAGKDFTNAISSYEEYSTPIQFSRAMDSVNIGTVNYDAKDTLSYYDDNYFYEAPYSIECVIYNYRSQMSEYVNTSKARYTKRELENIRSITENNVTYIEYALESCKSNSIYMWIIYIINSLVILSSYLLFRSQDAKTSVRVITRY